MMDCRGTCRSVGRRSAWLVRLIVFALALFACAAPSALAAQHRRGHARNVAAITRDSAGIPHITARNYRGLGYGDGYAFAQDNLCTLADLFVTVEGQRSRYFGADAVNVNYSAGASDTNLNSDLFWKYVSASRVVQKSIRARPPVGPLRQVRDTYRGWVAGYNAYLRSGKLRDPRCKGKPWVHRITTMDLYLRGEQIVTEGSAAQFISDLVDAVPPGAREATARTAGRRRRGGSEARTPRPRRAPEGV
jgi:acyl-homoserine-lactone acylase